MAEPIRRITVDGIRYGSRVSHRHISEEDATQRVCVDKFMAFRDGTPKAPLRISFRACSVGGAGYLQEHGVVLLYGRSITLNLHRPRTAAALIRRAVSLGWAADSPLEIDDGLGFIADLPGDILDRIAEPTPGAHSS